MVFEVFLLIVPAIDPKEGTCVGIQQGLMIPVFASCGVGNLEHIYEGFTKGRADAALAASIFHFKEYTIRQAKDYLNERGVPVRL